MTSLPLVPRKSLLPAVPTMVARRPSQPACTVIVTVATLEFASPSLAR